MSANLGLLTKCPLCYGPMIENKRPITLICGHTICEQCIEPFKKENKETHSVIITCTTCARDIDYKETPCHNDVLSQICKNVMLFGVELNTSTCIECSDVIALGEKCLCQTCYQNHMDSFAEDDDVRENVDNEDKESNSSEKSTNKNNDGLDLGCQDNDEYYEEDDSVDILEQEDVNSTTQNISVPSSVKNDNDIIELD